MIRFITPLTLCLVSSTAIASPQATSWQDAVAEAMADADPEGDWQRVRVGQPSTAPGEAEITLTYFRDGSTSAEYHGDVTLKRGIVVGTSLEGSQALLLATDILACDWELGCRRFDSAGMDLDINLQSCVSPLCGGDLDVLVEASPAYLVADVITQRDGSQIYAVTDLIVGLQVAFSGIEPDEID